MGHDGWSVDVDQMNSARLQEGVEGRGHSPSCHGLPWLEDLVLPGIAEIGYDQGDFFVPADIQQLQEIDQILIGWRGLDYCHLVIQRRYDLSVRLSIGKCPVIAKGKRFT
jgi:hypothetical protein